jgi:glycosyltransferase involved in cell wall biosynthesis
VSRDRGEDHDDVKDTARRITVYHPSTQHSLLLSRALVRAGYDTSLVTRFETESAMRKSATARLAYKMLDKSETMQRALENRSAGHAQTFSTDPTGILLSRLIGQTAGRSARQRFDRSRMRHSAKAAAKLMRRELHPELVIAATTGALELLDEVGEGVPVVIDIAHPHPKEVDRCRRLAAARYPDFASSWDDPPLEASGWAGLDQALTRATGVWTASRYTADTFRTFVDPTMQVEVVSYGVVGVPRPRWGSAYDGRYLFVGAVGLRKGVPLLVEAWVKSGLANDGCVLDLVGRKLHRHVEEMLARTAGIQRHVDISSQALSVMFQRADALVSPSYCEGFGRVLIEAATVGLPFLASRTGAVDDILGPDLDAWSVEVDDVEGFTELLRRFHGQSSSRVEFVDALLGTRGQWTEEAYISRLRSAVEHRFNAQALDRDTPTTHGRLRTLGPNGAPSPARHR